ncbi:MAG: hypothetical protein ABWY36_07555 [Leifsonia sp.]
MDASNATATAVPGDVAPGGVPSGAVSSVDVSDESAGYDPAPWSPSATASSWLGVIGLIVTLFMPWGAIASVVAIVLGIAARPEDSSGRANRITGIVTGCVGIAFAAVWILVVVRHVEMT